MSQKHALIVDDSKTARTVLGRMLEKQMKKYRYLTKSRFKLATECPTKLYYTGKKEYLNQKYEDSFLLALAEGGFQVEIGMNPSSGARRFLTLALPAIWLR